MMDKEEGGLVLTAISDLAQDRKLKMLMSNIDKDDATGHAFKGMIGRGHRDAGNGGLEDTEMIMENTLGNNTWMKSLVQWLGEMRIYLRSNGSRKAPQMAAKVKKGKAQKIIMNKKGILLRSETDDGIDGEVINIRVGQCWKRGKEIIEITGLGDETAEVMI